MTKLRWLAAGAVIAALSGYALAQGVSTTLTGNETVQMGAGGPGGGIVVVPAAELRNARALRTFSGSGAQTYTAVPTDSTLYWVGTAPTTWTITTPATPWDGQILTVGTDTTLTTLVTLTANTGQTLNTAYSSQTITAPGSSQFQYLQSTAKWYRIR